MKVNINTLMLNPEVLMTRLERAGFYTVESKLPQAGYVIKDGNIVIVAGNSGSLSIDIKMIDGLIEELKEIKEIAKFRQIAQVKGA